MLGITGIMGLSSPPGKTRRVAETGYAALALLTTTIPYILGLQLRRSSTMRFSRSVHAGFSLIELLVVLAIVSMLTAVLLPVFWTVRGKARQSACVANLHQLGNAVAMYRQDYDGFFPYAVDPADRFVPYLYVPVTPLVAQFKADIPVLPTIQQVLFPYTRSNQVFHCPSDIGFGVPDYVPAEMNAYPSSFEKFGTSYYGNSSLGAVRLNDSTRWPIEKIDIFFDYVGYWHGTPTPIVGRYNVVFADGHVENVNREQMDDIWKPQVWGGRYWTEFGNP